MNTSGWNSFLWWPHLVPCICWGPPILYPQPTPHSWTLESYINCLFIASFGMFSRHCKIKLNIFMTELLIALFLQTMSIYPFPISGNDNSILWLRPKSLGSSLTPLFFSPSLHPWENYSSSTSKYFQNLTISYSSVAIAFISCLDFSSSL